MFKMIGRVIGSGFRMIGRGFWLIVLACIGLLITKPVQTFDVAAETWGEAARYISPPLIMPGPIGIKPGSDPSATVVITADDGQLSWYEILYPVLQKYRLPCTHFIVTKRVGDYNFMTWKQIKEVKHWGCDIEAHGRTHRDLDKLDEKEATYEIAGSRQDLREHLGGDFPAVIASPEGNYDKEDLRIMRETGFEAHVRGWGGENGEINDMSDGVRNPFELVRYNVGNYHSAGDICDAVKKAEGKPQLLILMYHFGATRRGFTPKLHFKTMREVREDVAPALHVFADVFDKTMACIAKERDAGHIRLSSIPEALAFYEELAKQKRLAMKREEDEPVETRANAREASTDKKGEDARQETPYVTRKFRITARTRVTAFPSAHVSTVSRGNGGLTEHALSINSLPARRGN